MSVISLSADRRWTGFSSYVLYPLFLATVLSATILCMSCILALQLYEAGGNTQSKGIRPPTLLQIMTYNLTTPLLSSMYGAITISLHLISLVRPSISLITTAVFLIGWIVTVALWANCDFAEIHDSAQPEFCKNWPSLVNSLSGGSTTPLEYARFSLAIATILVFWACVVYCISAMRNLRIRGQVSREMEIEMDKWDDPQ